MTISKGWCYCVRTNESGEMFGFHVYVNSKGIKYAPFHNDPEEHEAQCSVYTEWKTQIGYVILMMN